MVQEDSWKVHSLDCGSLGCDTMETFRSVDIS
jgi:hypothetical protein